MKCLANRKTAEKVRTDMRTQAVEYYAVLIAYILTDKYGYGKKKLHDMFSSLMKLSEEINDKDIQFEEIREVLKDEYDFEIK